MNRTEKLKKIIPYCLIVVFAILYYLLNRRMGVYAIDDVWYATNLITNEPIQSLNDIITGQIWHYFNWGGRTPAHTILQLTFWLGDNFIDVFNVFAYLLYIYILNLFIEKRSVWTFLALESILFVFNLVWTDSLLWQTGIANYLYMSIFNMTFLLLYLKQLQKENVKPQIWMNFVMIPLGLLAGWSNENVGPALFIGAVTVIVMLKRKKRSIPFWMYTGSISCLIGSVLLILAPGNRVRLEEVSAANSRGVLIEILYRVYELAFSSMGYLFAIICLLMCALFVYKGIKKRKLSEKTGILLVMAILSWGAMALSPHYPQRATFGTMCFLACVITELFSLSVSEDLKQRKAMRIASIILWIINMYLFSIQYIQWHLI